MPSDYSATIPGENKICPLMTAGLLCRDSEASFTCKGCGCAWYDVTKEKCAVLSIARK